MPDYPTLRMDVSVLTEKREDRWAFYVQEFGFTVYGKTEQEGEAAVNDAVGALLKSFRGDDLRLRKFLDARQVKHSFGTAEDAGNPPLTRMERREIEVPLAVAV